MCLPNLILDCHIWLAQTELELYLLNFDLSFPDSNAFTRHDYLDLNPDKCVMSMGFGLFYFTYLIWKMEFFISRLKIVIFFVGAWIVDLLMFLMSCSYFVLVALVG